ncbi:hypothetical protein F4818DRAFT_435595 [Hypoxylon cercidicola]|nr:hypothetical protein F4818DRAFT_435595 [Hypoxylon cercidicola]
MSDSSYGDHPGGGAPLYPPSSSSFSNSPSPGPETNTTQPTIPTSRELETELMIASSAFAQGPGPFGTQPTVPRSVQPSYYGHGRGRGAAPTPPGNMGPRSLTHTRFPDDGRSSASAGFSAGFPGWGPGAGGAGMGEDDSLRMSRTIQGKIMTCVQFIQRLPNIPAHVAGQHQQICQEISQGLNAALHQLRTERDAARGDQGDLHHRYQQTLYAHTSSEAERHNLQIRLNNAMEREDSTKREVQEWMTRAENVTNELASLEEQANKFQQHHAKITADWENQDKRSFKQIQALENEVKKLRGRITTLAEKAKVPVEEALKIESNEFPAPSLPSAGPASHRSLDKETKDDLLARLMNPSGKKESGSKVDESSSSFKPNPQAPAWQPPVGSKTRGEKNRYSTPAPAESEVGSTVGGPSNWPVVVSHDKRNLDQYDGASTSSKAVVPTRGRQPNPPAFKHTSMPAAKASGSTMTAQEKERWGVQDIRDAIEHLYAMTKGYVVNCHLKANDPPQVAFDRIEIEERPTWTYLLNLVYPNPQQAAVHIRYLLSIDSYRQHVLMRVVLDYVFKKMLSPRVFLGISAELDEHLSALQDQIAALGQPEGPQNTAQILERQRVLEQHARVIGYALQSEGAERFKQGTVKRHAEVLCRILKPLRCISADDDKAMLLLQLMTEHTWDISSKVWMSGMTLNYQFAECGTVFTYSTMEALNAGPLGYGLRELQTAHIRVSFVATPMLTVRDERREGADVAVHGVKKAGVLIMK